MGGIIASNEPPKPKAPPIDDKALWVWGRLQDFERQGILDADPAVLMASLPESMRDTVREYADRVATWLRRIKP